MLEYADLYRTTLVLPLAFEAAKAAARGGTRTLEAEVRKRAAIRFRQEALIPGMIDRIKELFDGRDRHA